MNRSCFHMSSDYIFFLYKTPHKNLIFLPALASGFTPPQGDSRWGSPMPFGLGLSLRNIHCYAHLGFNHMGIRQLFSVFTTTQHIVSNYCLGVSALGIKRI